MGDGVFFSEDLSTKKEAKKTKDIRSIAYRTVAKGITPIANVNSQLRNSIEQKSIVIDDEKLSADQRRRRLKNAEIDEFLLMLVDTGLLQEDFISWGAKCVHILGLTRVNLIAVNARNGKHPQRLFNYNLKGALDLHYKRKFFEQDRRILDRDR